MSEIVFKNNDGQYVPVSADNPLPTSGSGGGGPVDWDDIENKPNLADGGVYQYLEAEAGGEIIAAGFIAKSFDIGSPGNTESLDQLAINADETVVSGGVKVNGDLQVIGDKALFMTDVEVLGELEVRDELRLRKTSSALSDAVLSTATDGGTETILVSSAMVQAPTFLGSFNGAGDEITVGNETLLSIINDLTSRIEALEAQLDPEP